MAQTNTDKTSSAKQPRRTSAFALHLRPSATSVDKHSDHLLLTTDKPISEIGIELGYEEKAYFSRVFKKNSGQSPSEFREEMRKLVA